MIRVIFLDLDGTLLGSDYSPEGARPVIGELLRRGYEVVVNTSKTRFEVEYYLKAWDLEKPFVVENGSAVYVPVNYLPPKVVGEFGVKRGKYRVIELGKPYPEIKRALDGLSQEYGLKYYGNSSLEEVITFSGLPEGLAKLAMKREYSETIFRWEKEGFEAELEKMGLKVSRGTRFLNVTGNTDKGKGARALLELYSLLGEVESYALGDGENDFPLFEVVDNAFIVGSLSHPKAKHISSIEELLEVIP
ncbi:mannosyl-3-phosphoglycerate phosphatase [Thermococcus sp. 21S9]|uniref:mannosyl-3-phosphoglycerate phosphatase n=1 Tax=Thermococcus sp. 21S9 TaxID=1638223 RepID=UPI00168EB46C|nr:mannosyl-3-phosphoglycerate phosphatase [Thermococcus sp. 21S9]NJE55030.1 mannosyl-3-phosphoglycerate phosphatase [Thermococcus sp. 21S9]